MYFRDLGYVPINGISPRSMEDRIQTAMFDMEDGTGCGPLGPPVPDYVPGNIVINRELIEAGNEVKDNIHSEENSYVHRYLNDENDEEEDDVDSPTSGIFARLRSAARKYSTCSQ